LKNVLFLAEKSSPRTLSLLYGSSNSTAETQRRGEKQIKQIAGTKTKGMKFLHTWSLCGGILSNWPIDNS